MDKRAIILETADMVKEKLKNEGTGHDWYHIKRVWKTAQSIGEQEKANLFIIEMAALLHDLIDDKLVKDASIAAEEVEYWLEGAGVHSKDMESIISIIHSISFKGGGNRSSLSLEGQIVQDADRLDAIGAIGIGRCFSYAGSKGHVMFDPELSVREQMTEKEYREGKTSAIHHFYEKLLKLKDLMNTESGKQLAEDRHAFMEDFLVQFFEEWGE
ncbi:HD domain-containing protein [Alkalibacterium iburiense]|uniref:HD domain-containing protein n=1 Tax=Alkalibacterium iburiense TaxID=290589 RepID=A0ABN0XSR8_9LACT